ncbi:MAG: glycosyltransferase [Oscillospiraceae bacterium]|nr:glycosyltransferase [Oscillospiraceae bacterium]
MKVLLYTEGLKYVGKSGLGRAIKHQIRALESAGVEYTLDPKEDYDIVHINSYGLKSRRLARKARRMGKKVVYHAHSTEEDFRNSFILSNQIAPLFKKWLVSSYQLGDHIVTPTPYSKKLLEGYGIKKPVTAVSNGIDLAFYERPQGEDGSAFRERFGFSKEEKVVMAVGLYIERKGILDFVELARRMPEYRFIWFGYTDPKLIPQKIKDALKTNLPNLSFPGYVEPEVLRTAYYGADLFVFPTYEETEGIVLLEALAARQKVLIRDIPIYADWFTDGETVYKASSVDEFEEKIRGILEGTLPDLSGAGYALAKEKDLRRIGLELKRIYELVLSKR